MTDTTEASDRSDAAGGASSGHPGMPRSLVVVFAVACGLAVANLYYAQPVLYDITRSFGTNEAEAGLVVTLSQIGYARRARPARAAR